MSSQFRWQASSIDHILLDFDACFPEIEEYCGVGQVIQNHEGQVLAAFGRTLPKHVSIVLAELLAIREGLKDCTRKGFSPCDVIMIFTL